VYFVFVPFGCFFQATPILGGFVAVFVSLVVLGLSCLLIILANDNATFPTPPAA
jgi:hypothetical protein